jgi:hypothetical protein
LADFFFSFVKKPIKSQNNVIKKKQNVEFIYKSYIFLLLTLPFFVKKIDIFLGSVNLDNDDDYWMKNYKEQRKENEKKDELNYK